MSLVLEMICICCFEMMSNTDNHGVLPITPRRYPPLLAYVGRSKVQLGKDANKNGE